MKNYHMEVFQGKDDALVVGEAFIDGIKLIEGEL